jgi:hypothetical protein
MSSIFDKTYCLIVSFHAPGPHRHADMSEITTDADKKELSLSKRIFDSETYQANRRVRTATKAWLEKRAVPSPLRNGTYLIPVTLMDSVNEKLDEAIVEYKATAEAFVLEYPSLIEQWKEKLGKQFKAADYPSQNKIRRRFGIDRMVLNFSPARPDEINQSAEIEQAIVEIKVALRAGLLELVNRLSSMLSERADGKRKGFQGKALESFTEWMALLPARLVVDDAQLMKLAEQAKKIMAGKSTDDLKNIEQVRSQVKAGLEKVGAKLEGMLKTMPGRAFGFDD